MLSVCIPVYNTDISALLNALIREKETCNLPLEIIVIDDASLEKWRKVNRTYINKVRYFELNSNIGRAGIRNLFLQYATYQYLMFIDNDSLIISEKFLSKYLESIKQDQIEVICGGRIYDNKLPPRNKRLRWKYGIKKESRSLARRINDPYKAFMTNNFLLHRKILEKIPFDERLTEYGHEDTLFGYSLKREAVSVKHIDNPVMNGDIENNKEYLKKTEEAVKNLIKILEFTNNDPSFIDNITILRFYKKLSSLYLINTVYLLFIFTKSFLKFLLLRGRVCLFMFNFYKLGILIVNQKRKN